MLHIRGAFEDFEKVNIEEEKVNIGDGLGAKTKYHVQLLFNQFTYEKVFGRSDVMKVIGIKETRASILLKKLYELEIIEPVSGLGKGKYRFKKK